MPYRSSLRWARASWLASCSTRRISRVAIPWPGRGGTDSFLLLLLLLRQHSGPTQLFLERACSTYGASTTTSSHTCGVELEYKRAWRIPLLRRPRWSRGRVDSSQPRGTNVSFRAVIKNHWASSGYYSRCCISRLTSSCALWYLIFTCHLIPVVLT